MDNDLRNCGRGHSDGEWWLRATTLGRPQMAAVDWFRFFTRTLGISGVLLLLMLLSPGAAFPFPNAVWYERKRQRLDRE